IQALMRQISVLAASEALTEESVRAQADTCRRLAERLEDAGRLPEALQAYQEATDAYGRIPGAEPQAAACARRIVEGVRDLWKRPEERLYLLIARIEREQRQLALVPDSEARQADCAFRIGTIFQRRDRFVEAESSYLKALDLYVR